MRSLARRSSESPTVIGVATAIISSLPFNPPKRDIARAIFLWVKQHIHFVEDEEILSSQLGYTDVHQELLIAPDLLLRMPIPMGDCDDFAVLTASLLIACKIPAKFIALATDESEPFRFSHVYVGAYLSDENGWVAIDSSHGSVLGWEYSGPTFRRAEWAV